MMSSEDEIDKIQYRYTVRTFKFYKSQSEIGVSFYPMEKYLDVPLLKEKEVGSCGLSYEPASNSFIIFWENLFFLLSGTGKSLDH